MEEHTPDVLAAIVEADMQSRKRLSGHGPALAQAYNHTILPLSKGHPGAPGYAAMPFGDHNVNGGRAL